MNATKAYGIHVLISAIKYLDGTHAGHDGSTTATDRRVAIRIMLSKLSKGTKKDLLDDRKVYWEVGEQNEA